MSDRSGPAAAALFTLRSPLVAVAAPLFFVVFGLFLPAASALHFSLFLELSFPLLFAAVAAVSYLIGTRLAGSRANRMAAGIREFVGTVVGVGLAAWGLLHPPLAGLVRRPEFWIAEATAVILWAFVGHFRSRLEKREFFLAAVLRAAETRSASASEGGAVLAAARDFAIEAGEATDGVKRCRRWQLFFLIWLIGLLVVSAWALHAASPFEQAGVAVSAVVVLAGLLALARMDEEQRFVMEGLLPSRRGASLAAALALPLFALWVAAAVVLASRPALLSPAVLTAILAWIALLFSLIPSPKARPAAPPPPPRALVPQGPELFHALQRLPSTQGSELIGRILTYLGWSLLAVVAAGLLWLLLSPLFRLRYRRGGFARLLRAAGRGFAAALGGLLARLRELLASLLGLRAGRLSAAAAREGQARGRGARRSAAGKRGGLLGVLLGGPNRRFARAFLRLARWGEQHGVPFSRSTAPREYAALVGARLPAVGEKVTEIAVLFERHLFSPRPLDSDQLSVYFRRITEVVRGGGN